MCIQRYSIQARKVAYFSIYVSFAYGNAFDNLIICTLKYKFICSQEKEQSENIRATHCYYIPSNILCPHRHTANEWVHECIFRSLLESIRAGGEFVSTISCKNTQSVMTLPQYNRRRPFSFSLRHCLRPNGMGCCFNVSSLTFPMNISGILA